MQRECRIKREFDNKDDDGGDAGGLWRKEICNWSISKHSLHIVVA